MRTRKKLTKTLGSKRKKGLGKREASGSELRSIVLYWILRRMRVTLFKKKQRNYIILGTPPERQGAGPCSPAVLGSILCFGPRQFFPKNGKQHSSSRTKPSFSFPTPWPAAPYFDWPIAVWPSKTVGLECGRRIVENLSQFI